MGKMVTSGRRKASLRKPRKSQKENDLSLEDFEGASKEHDPSEYLTNPDNLGRAIVECLENNDPEAVMEVIAIHLEAVNKSKISSSKLHRQTIYSALKHRNPTIKTLSKIMYEFTNG